MNWLNKKATKIISEMVIASMPKIKVVGGMCRYNFRCQCNSVHDAINAKHDKIAMVFYFCDDAPIIHFINVSKSGKYIDNTLGHWATIYDYYLIRHIGKDEFFNVNKIFDAYRKELHNRLPFFIDFFSDCEF